MQAVRTPKVTVIPAKKDIPLCALSTEAQAKLLRVAAYARVSTDSAEQLTSYRAQVDYYTRYIAGHDGWALVEVYTDATVIIGLKQNPTHGRRFSPIFFA